MTDSLDNIYIIYLLPFVYILAEWHMSAGQVSKPPHDFYQHSIIKEHHLVVTCRTYTHALIVPQ